MMKYNNESKESSEWRRQGQERYLFGVNLIYHSLYSGRNHDHCEFCGEKFSSESEDLGNGYSTEDKYHWICTQCFNDFKVEFQWSVKV